MACSSALPAREDARVCEELELFYQPIVDLHTFAITAVEALIRWNHPYRGRLLPKAFLAKILKSSARARVTCWILRTAANQLAAWHSSGLSQLRMSVNIAVEDLLDRSLPASARDAARSAGVPPQQIEIEVSERGAITENAQALSAIDELRSDGFRIAVDDFGAGSASLRYLLDIPASTIKFDRSFVAGAHCIRHAIVLDRACRLATSLGFEVVVEGIENANQLGIARAGSANYGQGYYFGRPQSADAIGAWLA